MSDTGVLSNNTPTPMNLGEGHNNMLYRGIITKRYFVDDRLNVTQNASNPQVLYDCAILGGFSEGQIITNCRLASWLGGQFNYAERVLKPNSKPLNEVPLKDQDGDIVFFQYIQGQKLAPIIVAMGTQPKDGDATGAKKKDGPRWVEQYNGVETTINRDGEYSLTVKGGELDMEANTFKPSEDTILSSITMDKDKKVNILTMDGPSLAIDGTADSINITTNGGDKISLAKGTVTIENSGGIMITMNSSGININGGSEAQITADRILLNGGMVQVGEGAGLHSTLFENLKSEFESHIHQVPQAMGGILPSQKPLIPLTPTVGSQSVTVKD